MEPETQKLTNTMIASTIFCNNTAHHYDSH
jgi:hypothetical protein